jgi:hypothetical protein
LQDNVASDWHFLVTEISEIKIQKNSSTLYNPFWIIPTY